MIANHLTVPIVTPGQLLLIPFNTEKKNNGKGQGKAFTWEELMENDISREEGN